MFFLFGFHVAMMVLVSPGLACSYTNLRGGNEPGDQSLGQRSSRDKDLDGRRREEFGLCVLFFALGLFPMRRYGQGPVLFSML